jgi:hypothetical protein
MQKGWRSVYASCDHNGVGHDRKRKNQPINQIHG